jgi:hypothetical protein
LTWPQKIQMGLVSLTKTLYTGVNSWLAITGTNPDLRPGRVGVVRLAAMGLQGWAKLDSVTV